MHLNVRPFGLSLGLAALLLLATCPLAPQPAQGATALGLQDDFIRVAEQVMPSVVSLKAIRVVTVQPFGPPDDFSGARLLRACSGRWAASPSGSAW